MFRRSVLTLNPPSWFPDLVDSVLDSPAATPLIRRTLIIIPTATIGTRTFITILIPITAPHTIDPVGTGLTTVTIVIITTAIDQL